MLNLFNLAQEKCVKKFTSPGKQVSLTTLHLHKRSLLRKILKVIDIYL